MYTSETNSTNTLLREMIVTGKPTEFIYTGFQTAGRGQSGNGWESERGKNLLCSILLPPQNNMFDINVLVSVAVCRIVKNILVRNGKVNESEHISVKWPNDIYYLDRKLAGILIENAIMGNKLTYSIAGIGLNVNQTEWHSDAPNPISLKNIMQKETDIHDVMNRMMEEIHALQKTSMKEVWQYYMTHLFRRQGWWPFAKRVVNTEPTRIITRKTKETFLAQITSITPQGEIVLTSEQGETKCYHFKEIQFII